MNDATTEFAASGEEVVRAIGELDGAAEAAARAASQAEIDHDEVKGWIKTIAEAIMSIIK